MVNKKSLKDSILGITIHNYSFKNKVNEGNFGRVYVAEDPNKNEFAVKVETKKPESEQKLGIGRKNKVRYYLPGENRFYTEDLGNGFGIPKIYEFFSERHYYMMVMQLLGPNLHEIYEKQNKKFSDSCLYKIVYLMITILEYVHSKGIVYRDIKPENFLTRKYLEDYELYIADFGLSTYFIDQSSGKKFPKEENQSLVGTTRYMSTNAHSRLRQAPRDDLESVAYVAAYFISGKLPWQGIVLAQHQDRNKAVLCRKREATSIQLFSSHIQLGAFFDNVKVLSFEETPDYQKIKTLAAGMYLDVIETIKLDWEEGNEFSTREQTMKPPFNSIDNKVIMGETVPAKPKKKKHKKFLCL